MKERIKYCNLVIAMAQLCASSSSSTDDAHGTEMVKAKLKRIPRCMQIDLLPLVATNMTMTRMHRPNKPTETSPAIWDKDLQVWTRNGSMMPFVKPSISKVDDALEEHLQPLSNYAEEPILSENTSNESIPISNNLSLTRSDSFKSFSPINLANAPGRAWQSSIKNVSNCRGRDVLFGSVEALDIEKSAEQISQQLDEVENMCTDPNIWDTRKQQAYDDKRITHDRSCSLNDCQHGTSLTMKRDENEECTVTIIEDFLEPQLNIKPLKLCPAFISPWLGQKPCPFPDSPETLSGSPSGSLDWTGDETTDAEGFDGVGLRHQSDRNGENSRRRDRDTIGSSSSRNTRQRVEDAPNQNLISDDLDDFDRFEPGANLLLWFPRPGDIIIHEKLRPGDHLGPGGHVTLYKDEEFFKHSRLWRQLQVPFANGDIIVRIGKFTEDWIFHQIPRIETFLYDYRVPPPGWLVARTFNHQLQPPENQFDPHFRAPVNTVDRIFSPRLGDLVVRVVRGQHVWGLYWWNYNFNFNPGDMVLRAGYEVKPNGTRMVVEFYYRELDDRDWSFRGRDFWTYINRDYRIPDPEQPQPMQVD